MTPNPNAVRSAALADSPAAQTPARLPLDPNEPAEHHLDGTWWPCSTELAAELPALLTALSARLGPVALIGYRRDAWNAAPDHLDLAGHEVHLQGFVSPNPPTLVVVDDRGQHVTMRVVPPETKPATAAELIAAVAVHDSVEPDDADPAANADKAEATYIEQVAARLSRRLSNTDPQRTGLISQWVAEATEQFRQASIQAFVPILVEHIVRDRPSSNRGESPRSTD